MEFRFRYLGPRGEEIEVASLERLRVLVQDETVGELTLLFDALTREWAPARAHAVYRFLRDESRLRSGGPPPPPSINEKKRPRSRAPESADPPPRAATADSLGLDLEFSLEAPADILTAEQAAAEILRERAREDDLPQRPSDIRGWAPTPPSPSAPAAVAASPVGVVVSEAGSSFARRPPVPRDVESTYAGRRPAPVRRSVAERIHGGLDAIGNAVLDRVATHAVGRTLAIGGTVGLLLVLLATVRRSDVGTVTSEPAPPGSDMGRLVASLGPAQETGFQSMVAGVDSLRRAHEILRVPAIWLEGKYLADAPRYPEVRNFWLRYRAFLADVRANDTTLFRAGFVQSLKDQGIAGPVLTLRLGHAMKDFAQTQYKREDVYRQMDELSAASLQLHDLLVERAADITYEPAIQHGVSREPVVEAVAEDTLLRDHMWTLLERIFASLERVGGGLGGSRDNLTESLLQGIQASAR